MKCSRDTIYISKFVFFLVFDIVHNFFYPHFPIRFRHPQVSSTRFADTSFASRFFELFSLPASLRLDTRRRSASSMCAFKEEERSVLILCDINERNYWVQNCTNYWHHVLDASAVKGPTMWQRLERKISFLNCLFDYFYFFFIAIHISRFFSSYFFCYPHFFSIRIFLSAFSHPHPPSAGIRSAFYRHPWETQRNARVAFKPTRCSR